MASEEILLSGPCGYFGEVALWPLRNLRFAAASSGDRYGNAANPRSHFIGIRIVQNGNSWTCEALLDLSPALRAFGIPFACLTGSRIEDKDTPKDISYFPSDEKEVADFDGIEISPGLVHAAENFARHEEQRRKAADTLSELLATKILPASVHDLDPAHHEDYELPARDVSFEITRGWIRANREKLLRLRYEEVDELLSDAARELARNFQELRVDASQQNQPLDLRIDLFLMATSDFFILLSRILKLHWYLGHDDWGALVQKLDGGFPRTPPPSIAWTLNLRDDAPWWAAVREILAKQGTDRVLNEDLDEFREHDLIRLSRAWLWPAVYREAIEHMNNQDSVITLDWVWVSPNYQDSVGRCFRKYLGKYFDWWMYRLSDEVLRPVLIRAAALDSNIEEESDCELSDCFASCAVDDELGFEAGMNEKVALYRDEVIDAQDWEARYEEAFPSVGANLSVQGLLKKDRLSFALKALETEVEGESAWVRLVHNAVFEDAYGPQALALRVRRQMQRSLFSYFGQGAIRHAFISKSDGCEAMLREFVARILLEAHAERWLEDGVPEDVAKKRYMTNAPENVGAFLGKAGIPELQDILLHPANLHLTKKYCRMVGVELAGHERSIEFIDEWRKGRNKAKHSGELCQDDIESLDPVRRNLSIWLLVTRPLRESSRTD